MRAAALRLASILLLAAAPAACTSAQLPAASSGTVAPPAGAMPAPSSLGHIDFPVTGAPACKRLFVEGMLALHSFEYDQAHESFSAALAADASCAMAAWGDAMTYDHPLWHQRDIKKGRAALARVVGEDTLTPRERSFVAVARALFGEDDEKKAHAAWLAAAAKMHADFPGDDEVALQHALALLAIYGYDRAHLREQMEAGAIALDVLGRSPEHPGAAHYAIHAFDSRDHAILALPVARLYARIAPAAGHALHMPSHTFTALGLYKDVVPSNERAYAASAAWAKAHGKSPSERDWHSYAWLVAALLETGHPARARALLDDARALLQAAKDDSSVLRASYADMVTNYVSQTDRWQDLEALAAPVFARAIDEGEPGKGGSIACATHAPGGGAAQRGPDVLTARLKIQALRAEAAARAGDAAAAEARVAELTTVRLQMKPWASVTPAQVEPYWIALGAEIVARARARVTPSAAADEEAMRAMATTAQREDERVTAGPVFFPTARERLAQALAAAGKPREALVEYERDLDAHPGRALALLGAARAARAAGDTAKARARYAELAALWSEADADLPALAEVRAGAR